MADASGSKPLVRKDVWVQVPLRALCTSRHLRPRSSSCRVKRTRRGPGCSPRCSRTRSRPTGSSWSTAARPTTSRRRSSSSRCATTSRSCVATPSSRATRPATWDCATSTPDTRCSWTTTPTCRPAGWQRWSSAPTIPQAPLVAPIVLAGPPGDCEIHAAGGIAAHRGRRRLPAVRRDQRAPPSPARRGRQRSAGKPPSSSSCTACSPASQCCGEVGPFDEGLVRGTRALRSRAARHGSDGQRARARARSNGSVRVAQAAHAPRLGVLPPALERRMGNRVVRALQREVECCATRASTAGSCAARWRADSAITIGRVPASALGLASGPARAPCRREGGNGRRARRRRSRRAPTAGPARVVHRASWCTV